VYSTDNRFRAVHGIMTRRPVYTTLWLLAASCGALDNGVGRAPALGWSSWYCSPGGSQVTSAFVRANAEALIASGLAAKGYVYVNVDEGWLLGRRPNGTIYEDRTKFPEGMAGLGEWVHAQETSPGSGEYMRYGLYTCRGTCQCSTGQYSGPGSAGYEAPDVDWMAAAGMDWLKVDSCCASQDHATAFHEYALFRDALNATGRRVLYNLCGVSWALQPAPIGTLDSGIHGLSFTPLHWGCRCSGTRGMLRQIRP
jgi:alpha-galactosidase